jgi:energy-coupling factor transporter ATP-binding protein EcfA2
MPEPTLFSDLNKVASHLRNKFNTDNKKAVLLFAHNGIGKTQLSMAFKNLGKTDDDTRDTLYFNAFTEDLFYWDNDIVNDKQPTLKINTSSKFFNGLEQLEMENRIRPLLGRYADSIIDYDYIMKLIAQYSQGKSKQKMTRDQLIGLLTANSNFMDERDDIIAYINTLKAGEGLTEEQIREGYKRFINQKIEREIANIAAKHGLDKDVLFVFVDSIKERMIFDGDKLSDLMEPFDLGWKERTKKEGALMNDLIPLFKKLANGREISGLAAYE